MTLLSTIAGNSGDIPTGDKLRIESPVLLGTSQVTLLTVASGGGFLSGVLFSRTTNNFAPTVVVDIKVTVDGASERTYNLSGNIQLFHVVTIAGYIPAFFLPLPLKFLDSLTLKINVSETGTPATYGAAIYSVN